MAQLDGTDAFSESARALGDRLQNEGAELVLLDILVNEAVSVICRRAGSILDVIHETKGRLNFNDAFLVALQRDELIDEVATFDQGFDVVPEFRHVK